jgi:hypothetical protein
MSKLLTLVLLSLVSGCQGIDTDRLNDGDIIFHTSASSQSQAIQAATHSKYSHMGLIYRRNNQYYVFEAVQPVKLTPLGDWIRRGKGGHYVVKRLIDAEKILTSNVLEKMKAEGSKYLGKGYDLYFEWSDQRIYCSELVWKIYNRVLGLEIGKLQRFHEFDLSHPVVKAKLKERYGDKIPRDEPVISPDQMFRSNLLETVVER